jgi:quinol monooxygenase YgiN
LSCRWHELEIDPTRLDSFKAAAREQIETAIRVEPGVLVLYSVSERDNPTHIKVLEIYRDVDAYKSHLESAHFKKYRLATKNMRKALKLVPTVPVILGTKAR